MRPSESRLPPGRHPDASARNRASLQDRARGARVADPRAMSDLDLLARLAGTKPGVAASLLAHTGGLAALSRASQHELSQVRGVGARRAARIAAAFELGRRVLGAHTPRAHLAGPADIARLLRPRVAGLEQEVFFAIGIDIRNGLLDIVEVARGSVHAVEVHPREVFRPLVRMAAAGGVIAHNHPTGSAVPSPEDRELTRRLREVGHVVGIPIVDHVVLAGDDFCSIAEYSGATM